jgi:2-deoxy-D-gluconate 3-dehydrogenase
MRGRDVSILDRFKLDGKTAVVTGARRGIGKAMAIALAEAGANIVGVSASLESEGSEIEAEVWKRGRGFRGFACDLADRASVYRFIETLRGEEPPVDILVNNAGTILRAPAAEHSDEFWDRVIEVNLNSQFILARELGRDMLQRGGGKIVFTASLLSFQGGITVPGYSASKGAVAQLVKALANEWAGRNVQVNGIAPGYVETDNTAALRADPVRNPAILARIPAGRWGKPEDLAGAVVFLASSASDYVSGEILTVDGGWMGR